MQGFSSFRPLSLLEKPWGLKEAPGQVANSGWGNHSGGYTELLTPGAQVLSSSAQAQVLAVQMEELSLSAMFVRCFVFVLNCCLHASQAACWS